MSSAIEIIELRSGNVLHLNLEEFKKITSKDDLGERSLVVISIAGEMRKGKSFLLNFFLTYAYNMYSTTKTIVNPKTFGNASLIDGFSHCGGADRHTTGIQVWPDIFLHDNEDGKKIAIIFIDTQGTFDYETNFSDCVSIFALSTLLSSVQIFNIHHNIQKDHLQYLALFLEYAKLGYDQISSSNETAPPFDTLQILVRDWNYPYEADYGLAGGKLILERTFSSTNSDYHKTISNIKDMFKKIDCFLMPHPGVLIATASRFKGHINEIDELFLKHTAVFVNHLLNPKNLQIKRINGVDLKVADFVNLIERSFTILTDYENIPKPKTIVAATTESQRITLITDAVNLYKKSLAERLDNDQYIDQAEFMRLHEKCMYASLEYYQNADKLETFDSEMDEQWRKQLNTSIARESNYFLIVNEKNQPNTSDALQTLINVVTEQKGMINNLNEQHAQDMLNLINTFRQREDDHRDEINELCRRFEESSESGFQFMDILRKIINIVPSTVKSLGKVFNIFKQSK